MSNQTGRFRAILALAMALGGVGAFTDRDRLLASHQQTIPTGFSKGNQRKRRKRDGWRRSI